MTLTVIVRFCPRTYYFLNNLFTFNGDGQDIHMRKYLKTVDFINTKDVMFKINPLITPRISPMNTKLYYLDIQGQGHYPFITHDNFCINHK